MYVVMKHAKKVYAENFFTRFMAFVCLTKYNGGKNILSVLATNDDENGDNLLVISNCACAQKNDKLS